MIRIPPDIQQLIARVGQIAPGLTAIWLIGSRANNTEKPSSDWDFLAVGGHATLEYLRAATELHHSNVDFLVVTNGDDFRAAWGTTEKHGSLAEWGWQELDGKSATYAQSKWHDAEDGAGVRVTQVRAKRMWP